MHITLYDYQERAVEALREHIRAGVKNMVLSAPTGSGKTLIAAHLIKECFHKEKRAVFVADRVNLIDQTSRLFDRYDIRHGVVQAQHWRRRVWERVQIASAQTLARRDWPPAELIVVDEAHTFHQNVLRKIGERQTVTIGLTATPFTKGMGKHYDAVVSVTTTNKLIEAKFLAPYRIFSASEPDMSGAKVVAGEWTDDEAARRSMPIVGDVVAEYLKHCAGKKFIGFGVNVDHCIEMQRQFMAAGVQCALYTYQTSDDERTQILRDYEERDGYLRGLISVGALAKGFDSAHVECVIMARPLRNSLAEHIQIFGRGLRRDPENPSKVCTILDHAGNCARLWDPTMEFFENGATELDDGSKKPKKATKPERQAQKCPKCSHVHTPSRRCPACGYEAPRKSNITHAVGTLKEVAGSGGASAADRVSLFAQLLWIALDRGYSVGWAKHKYRERIGSWPDGMSPDPVPPSAQLVSWVRSRAIAFARERKKTLGRMARGA